MPKRKKPVSMIYTMRFTQDEMALVKAAAALKQRVDPDFTDTAGTAPVVRKWVVEEAKKTLKNTGAGAVSEEGEKHEG